jgi:hypothetical protein
MSLRQNTIYELNRVCDVIWEYILPLVVSDKTRILVGFFVYYVRMCEVRVFNTQVMNGNFISS